MLPALLKKSPLLKGLIDFILPPLCLACGKFDEDAKGICPACRKLIDTYNQPLCLGCFATLPAGKTCPDCGGISVPLYAYGNYTSPLQDVIIQFKFHGLTAPAALLAPPLYEQFQKELSDLKADLVIPVPLYPGRERRRGYNQAALFAEQISQLLKLPMRTDILHRTEKRKPQARLNFNMREKNVRDVFTVTDTSEKTTRVILVDDVVTSGATAREACRELEQGGYHVCAVLAMAHSR
ncbi:MAG: ComF family protein [bacterium]